MEQQPQTDSSHEWRNDVLFVRLYQPNLELFSATDSVEGILLEHRSIKAISSSTWSSNGVEYAELFSPNVLFREQTPAGVKYSQNEHYTFKLSPADIADTALRFRLMTAESSRIYYASLVPLDSFAPTSGYRNASIVDTDFSPKGMLRAEYLLVKPLPPSFAAFQEVSSATKTADFSGMGWAGHRGTGIGLRTDLSPELFENTLDAYNYACRNGAGMVEVDVQLTRDMIPVIYHDFVRPVSAQSVIAHC